jgi:hypothetical protein
MPAEASGQHPRARGLGVSGLERLLSGSRVQRAAIRFSASTSIWIRRGFPDPLRADSSSNHSRALRRAGPTDCPS